MAVQFEEKDDSPTISFSGGRFSATRRFVIDWNDWNEFALELLGGVTVSGAAALATGAAHFPGVPTAIVSDVNFKPLGAASGSVAPVLGVDVNSYTKAEVEVSYSIPQSAGGGNQSQQPGIEEGTVLEYSGDETVEYQPTVGRAWEWPDGKKVAEDQPPGILIPHRAFQFSWSRVVFPPWKAIAATIGHVNNASFMEFPAGCVLFAGCRHATTIPLNDDGTLLMWRLDYSFSARLVQSTANAALRFGWNHLFRSEKHGGENWLEVNNDGKKLYDSADFTKLFQYESPPP